MHKSARIVLVLWFVLFGVLACARRRASAPILIGVRTSNCQTPFFVAEDQGLYAAREVHAEVRLVGSNTEIIEAMQRGEIQVGSLPVTTAIAAISRGAPLRIVAMSGRGSDGLLVRADGPTDVATLRGARIATIRASILDVLLREQLRRAGLNPDRDVELVYMSTLGDMISALKTGQVEATSNTEPFMTDAERQGWGRILGYYTAIWPDHPCCVVVAHEEFLRRRPEALRDILHVHCDAVEWAKAHPAQSAQIVVDRLQAFDAELVQASMQPAKMALDYRFTPDEIARMAALMAEQGLIEAVPAVERMADPAPLREAMGRR
ncbi:MAG: ABC transporter substrate-binding protein [Chloroflexi bacterium]|nr:ABC transporter substrate-binding protein [Chloroflexota bacterium]